MSDGADVVGRRLLHNLIAASDIGRLLKRHTRLLHLVLLQIALANQHISQLSQLWIFRLCRDAGVGSGCVILANAVLQHTRVVGARCHRTGRAAQVVAIARQCGIRLTRLTLALGLDAQGFELEDLVARRIGIGLTYSLVPTPLGVENLHPVEGDGLLIFAVQWQRVEMLQRAVVFPFDIVDVAQIILRLAAVFRLVHVVELLVARPQCLPVRLRFARSGIGQRILPVVEDLKVLLAGAQLVDVRRGEWREVVAAIAGNLVILDFQQHVGPLRAGRIL